MSTSAGVPRPVCNTPWPKVSAAKLRKTGIVTKGDLEGTACSPDEYERFSIIVCGESLQKCTYEWCDKYITAWRKKFGASVGGA